MAGRRALKAVLIDLSGTLHVEDTAVQGAQDALDRWEAAGRRNRHKTENLESQYYCGNEKQE